MTPLPFHESAALWLVSVGIARRLVLTTFYGSVYSNLAVLWLAITTLYRKSTALNIARNIAWRVFAHLLAAQKMTPEAFLSDLAGREPSIMDSGSRALWDKKRNFAAQQGLLIDEMSGLLAVAGRDYGAGLVEDIMLFLDCVEQYSRSTRSQGLLTVKNAYLSVLGASTPAAMASHLSATRLWAMGFWPRFAILTPEAGWPPWREAREHDEPSELRGKLFALGERLPASTLNDPAMPLSVTLGTDVFDTWRRYNKAVSYDLLNLAEYPGLDQRLIGTYGRLGSQVWRVSMILAALDWPKERGAPQIEMPHIVRAIGICESWRASAHRVLDVLAVSNFERLRQRVLRQIARREPKGASLRDVRNGMRDVDPKDLMDALEKMVKLNDVFLEPAKPSPRGGQPADRYHWQKHEKGE
jgi:hypothetical protein